MVDSPGEEKMQKFLVCLLFANHWKLPHGLQFVIIGERDKVEFYKADKHFWLAFLCQNWRSSFRSTENDLGLKVDIEDQESFSVNLKLNPQSWP